MVSGIGKQADADLMDMTQLSKYNDRVRFVLLHIDDFSRFIRTVIYASTAGFFFRVASCLLVVIFLSVITLNDFL